MKQSEKKNVSFKDPRNGVIFFLIKDQPYSKLPQGSWVVFSFWTSNHARTKKMELRTIFRKFRRQKDGHFVSMVTCLLLAVLTGRSDSCVSGVFGDGKTRAAAGLIAGLMIMDPSLNIMVMTKENTAAKAFTDHLLALGLPEVVYSRVGRIVGYLESRKGTSHQTRLDIQPEKRNDILSQKKLLIGCGGGYQQEASQRYSPVAHWLTNFQPHFLCVVVSRFAVGPPASMADRWSSYLRSTAAVEVLGKVADLIHHIPEDELPVFKAALAVLQLQVLWMRLQEWPMNISGIWSCLAVLEYLSLRTNHPGRQPSRSA